MEARTTVLLEKRRFTRTLRATATPPVAARLFTLTPRALATRLAAIRHSSITPRVTTTRRWAMAPSLKAPDRTIQQLGMERFTIYLLETTIQPSVITRKAAIQPLTTPPRSAPM